jgi:hypothetical protein
VDCNITLTNSNGAVASPPGPLNTVTDANGQCSITFTSQTAGKVTGNASSTLVISGQTVTVNTNGTSDNSGPAVKTFVDASIGITPQTAENPVGTNHTFTVTVRKNLGLGGGFVPAAGEHVDVNIVNSGGATATINTALSTCDNAGPNLDAAGTCTLVISSPTAGTTKAFATVTLSIGGVSVTRDANSTTVIPHGPGGTDEATKTWIPTPGGQITPTQVSCEDFISGTAPTLDQVNYSVSGGKIGQGINPGVFFFWTKITTTVPNQVVTVSQTNTSTNNSPLFKIHQGWIRLYAGDCSSWTTGTPNAGNTGGSFTVPTPGTWVIGIKYDVKSLAGTTPPVPADISFDFTTSLGGTTGASVLLKKKP